jgi:hypothetical protein
MARPDRFHVPDADPNFQYRWLNTREENLVEACNYIGWELVHGPSENPLDPMAGQSTDSPHGGVTRTRGDVVLARMPKEKFEREVLGEIQEREKRMYGAYDSMISQSNDRMRKIAASHGMTNIPKQMVFREDVAPSSDNPE